MSARWCLWGAAPRPVPTAGYMVASLMRGFITVVLCGHAAAVGFPETGDEMSWGEANKAFSDNVMDRDYARLSSSLDAADQFAGFRASDKLTRGVPFSKVPDLNFQGFAQGKADGGLDSRVREMTPYLASSHYINKLRSPMTDHFIYPQIASPTSVTSNSATPQMNVQQLNTEMGNARLNSDILLEERPLRLESPLRPSRALGGASPGGFFHDLEQENDAFKMKAHPAGMSPMSRELDMLHHFQMGANPYTMSSPFQSQQLQLLQQPIQARTLPGGLSPMMPPWAQF